MKIFNKKGLLHRYSNNYEADMIHQEGWFGSCRVVKMKNDLPYSDTPIAKPVADKSCTIIFMS